MEFHCSLIIQLNLVQSQWWTMSFGGICLIQARNEFHRFIFRVEIGTFILRSMSYSVIWTRTKFIWCKWCWNCLKLRRQIKYTQNYNNQCFSSHRRHEDVRLKIRTTSNGNCGLQSEIICLAFNDLFWFQHICGEQSNSHRLWPIRAFDG